MSEVSELIARAKALDASVLQGEWRAEDLDGDWIVTCWQGPVCAMGNNPPVSEAEARFVAESRTLVPAIANAAQQLADENRRFREALQRIAADEHRDGWAAEVAREALAEVDSEAGETGGV